MTDKKYANTQMVPEKTIHDSGLQIQSRRSNLPCMGLTSWGKFEKIIQGFGKQTKH